MSVCDKCGLYAISEKRCKIGKRVDQLFCTTQNFMVLEDTEETLDEVLQELATTDFGFNSLDKNGKPQRGVRHLQIGKPFPKGVFENGCQ